MPRINLGPNVPRTHTDTWHPSVMQAWYVDVCRHCWQDISCENPRLGKSLVSHPRYERERPGAKCWLCHAELGAADNYTSVVPEGAAPEVIAASV